MSAIATPLYYVNGRQHLNSDVKMNNVCTEIISSETVTLKGNSIALSGKELALSGTEIALSSNTIALSGTEIALSGNNIALTGNNIALSGTEIALNGKVSIKSLYISPDIATRSNTSTQSCIMTDKIAIFNKENRLIVYDLSDSDTHTTSFGGHSMENNKTAWGSSAFGYNALKSISSRTDISFANTAIGSNAMSSQQPITGQNNTSVGYNSLANISQGSSNVAIGSNALKTTTTGSCNTVVGYNSDTLKGGLSNINIIGTNNTTAFSNVNIIGSGINATASNKTYINNIDNLSGKQPTKSIIVYDPSTNEIGHASDMIKKCINTQYFISQQCVPLTSVEHYGKSKQGYSCAYSCKYPNNNIIVVGGINDNGGIGAVWVWALNNEMTLCSNIQKLVCDDGLPKMFGRSVAISYDTNTIAVGCSMNEVYIWYRPNVLSLFRQVQKIVAIDNSTISLSDDGTILLIGGEVWNKSLDYQQVQILINREKCKSGMSSDNSTIALSDGEGIYIFTKQGGQYQQQYTYTYHCNDVFSRICLSSNGNIFAFGNRIFTRIGTVWKREDDIIENTILSMTNDGSTIVDSSGCIWTSTSASDSRSSPSTSASDSRSSPSTSNKYIKKQSIDIDIRFDSAVISRNGNTMIVGDTGYRNDTGTVYLYFKERINTYINNREISRNGYSTLIQNENINIDGYCGNLALSGDGSTIAFTTNFNAKVFIYKKNVKYWETQITQSNADIKVALSYDGNTLAISDTQDEGGIGAVWIYKLLLNEYVKQGEKIVPSDNFGKQCNIGSSISLSYDGNILAIGASNFSPNGASWIYTYDSNSGTYIQQGLRIVGSTSSSSTPCLQGLSISLSGDGNILVIGGINMVWIYYKTKELWYLLHSISGNGKSISITKDGSMLVIGENIYKRSVNGNGKYSLYQTIEKEGKIVISGDGLSLWVDTSTYLYIWRRYNNESLYYQYGDKIKVDDCDIERNIAISYDGATKIHSVTKIQGAEQIQGEEQIQGASQIHIYNTNTNIQTTYTKQNTGYTSIGSIMPTAPLTVSSNGISSCMDMYGNGNGNTFQRFFPNTTPHQNKNQWWNVGIENTSFHIRNQEGTGVYINSGDQSWREYSDKKLQTNITDMDISGAYNKLLQLNPVTYQCVREDMKQKSGLLAEDVLPLFPQAVSKNDGYYGIGYTELIPYLIAGMKQQSAIISQQQKEIEALKSAFEIRLKEL